MSIVFVEEIVRSRYPMLQDTRLWVVHSKSPIRSTQFIRKHHHFRDQLNRLPESSVKVLSDSFLCSFSNRKHTYSLECGLQWRDIVPHGDRDEQRILKTQCSASMLKECRPSIKSSIGIRYVSSR